MPARSCPAPGTPVHPRVCGEHVVFSYSLRLSSGSSPRVWGTSSFTDALLAVLRFIPACVGNMVIGFAIRGRTTVHPRVCGEHSSGAHSPALMPGSSPRVWGTSARPARSAYRLRFIPACVGNMSRCRSPAVYIAVHPRVCGEHRRDGISRPTTRGSSPRVWGTLAYRRRRRLDYRFIPACVGNIRATRKGCRQDAVHPRVCGEHSATTASTWPIVGSSPRVWGTLSRGHPHHPRLRFIPACVGNITWLSRRTRFRTVHPRVCGEHFCDRSTIFSAPGSSPRVWGTYLTGMRDMAEERFIPACVGNIPRPRSTPDRWAVHPRVCGEHATDDEVGGLHFGSSPRVWGTSALPAAGRRRRRFIPACVGNMTS